MESVLRGMFRVPESVECRVWNCESAVVLKEPEQTLQNCSDGLVKLMCVCIQFVSTSTYLNACMHTYNLLQVMMLETRRSNGTWPKDPMKETEELCLVQTESVSEELVHTRTFNLAQLLRQVISLGRKISMYSGVPSDAFRLDIAEKQIIQQQLEIKRQKYQMEKELREKNCTIQLLQDRHDTQKKEIEGLKNVRDFLHTRISSLRESVSESQKATQTAEQSVREVEQRAQEQVKEKAQYLNFLIALRKQLITLTADLSESYAAHIAANVEHNAQKEEEALQKEKKLLQSSLNDLQARLADLKLNLKSAQTKSQVAKMLKELAYKDKLQLQKSVESKEKQILLLESRVQTEQKRSQDATLRVETLESQLREATQVAEVAQKATRIAQRQISEMSKVNDSRIRALEQQLQSAEQGNQQAQQKVSDLELHLHTMQERSRKLQQQLRQAIMNSEEKQQQITRLEEQLHESEQTKLQTQQQLTQVTRDHQEAQQRADDLDQRLRETELRLANSDQMFQDVFQRLLGQVPHSRPLWVVQRNEIQLTEEELGTGGWASVKVANFRGQRVAAKCLHHQIISAHNVRLFTREMNMAAQARHPNLLQFIGATMDDTPIILTELMPTSLRQVLEQGVRLSRRQIISITSDVARGLNYLHLVTPDPIVHRDVSSANVLMEEHGDVYKAKVSDYGSANFVRYTATAGPGNPLYSAPEANDPKRHSPKMDVYSFGLLLVEMCSGELFDDHEELIRTRIHDWPEMVRIIRSCIRWEPDRRPTMSHVLTELSQFNV